MLRELQELGYKLSSNLATKGLYIDSVEIVGDTIVLTSLGGIDELYYGRLATEDSKPEYGAWYYVSSDLSRMTTDHQKPEWATYLIGRGFRLKH